MDNSYFYGTSDSERENTEPMCSSSSSLGDHNTIDELSTGLAGELKINDANQSCSKNDLQKNPMKECYIEDEDEDEDGDGDGDGDEFSEEALLTQMGYAKSKTAIEYEEEEEEEEEVLSEDSMLAQMGCLKNEPPKHESITTPTADLNVVSAFKGSREKEGKPPKECRVSWAPDVYDPPCTSDDHFAPNRIERHKSEHKVRGPGGKNRQKGGGKGVEANDIGGRGGKGSRGGGSKGKNKDKKQADKKSKKHGGSSS